jgi:flagellar basal body rod protein FlgF
MSGALETSNVDLASELTEMIEGPLSSRRLIVEERKRHKSRTLALESSASATTNALNGIYEVFP